MKKVVAFDIEIATLIPEGETDWKKHRPLGITCAALTTPRGTWTYAARNEAGEFTDRMSVDQCRELLYDIQTLEAAGHTILTWNGLGFDWDILGEEARAAETCAKYAIGEDHIDMMFHFFAAKGYPVGLDAVSKGLGLPGKPEGVHGALAPEMWEEGRQQEVADYVVSDTQNTLDIYFASQSKGGVEIKWTARSGRPNTWQAERWLSVPEALALPEPDNSWMSDPWPRSKFYDWAMKAAPTLAIPSPKV